MAVSLVPVVHVDQIWPSLREGFQRSLMKTGGDLSTGDLWVKCRSGEGFLIVAHDGQIRGASVWRAETWQSGRKLRCLALYGEGMKHWIHDMRAMARTIANDCGATSLVSDGRLGWQKVFPNARVLRAVYEEMI